MVAFLTSLLLTVIMVAPIFPYAKRRPVGSSLTWGEAILGGTYIFFVLFWIYGVVPHHWLTWADSELNWRPDTIWLGPGGSLLEVFPVQVSAQVVRDIIATLIYVVFLGGQMWMWAWWQNRGVRAEKLAAIEPTSTYGRPLMKRAG